MQFKLLAKQMSGAAYTVYIVHPVIIVPLILIVMMSWVVFWIDPRDFGPQMGMATASVFTLIAFLLGHAHMDFINQGRSLGHFESRHTPLIGWVGLPYLGIEDQGMGVLHHPVGMGGDTVPAAASPMHAKPKQGAVGHRLLRKGDLPEI